MNTPPLSPSTHIGSSHDTHSASSSGATLQHDVSTSVQLPRNQTGSLQNMAEFPQHLRAYPDHTQLLRQPQGWLSLEPIRSGLKALGVSTGPKSSISNLKLQLEIWAKEPLKNANIELHDDRMVALNAISEVIDGHASRLFLDRLALDDLPDIFDHPALVKRLCNVHIQSCPFMSTLPPSLLRHPKLESLSVTSCALAQPPEFGHMPKLTLLNLSHNPLTHLPDSIQSLQLKRLVLIRTQLPALPDTITAMRSLQALRLKGSQFTTLPARIANLSALTLLDLSESAQLTSLPEELLELPGNCLVDISDCPLSQDIIRNLSRAQFYGGPQIHFSVRDQVQHQPSRPLEDNVTWWLGETSLTPEEKAQWAQLGRNTEGDQVDARGINSWLERVAATQDYQNLTTRPHVEARMQNLLSIMTRDLMSSGQQALSDFLIVGFNATATCQDRIASGLNDLETMAICHQSEQEHWGIERLQSTAREIFIQEQVHSIANTKAQGLSLVDEVEVHLAYQTGLKHRLQLTMGNSDMLYRSCSQVTHQNLDRAARQIRARLNNPEQLHHFYSQWTPMRKYIERQYSTELQAIKDDLYLRQEQAHDANDWPALEQLQANYEHRLNRFFADKIRSVLPD